MKIKNIHIRYEDKITNPGNPFCMGVTLKNLEVVTTDETWKPCAIAQGNVPYIFKASENDFLFKNSLKC